MDSDIPGFAERTRQLVVKNIWPGPVSEDHLELGDHWYSDSTDPDLFIDGWQGAKIVMKWRSEALLDWANRRQALNE